MNGGPRAGVSRRVDRLLTEIRGCRICGGTQLPFGPRPVLQASASARLLIVSQAPGRKVHGSGIAFNDVSGERLRAWLGIDRDTFYDADRVAIAPMGLCFPGSARGGDLPPRPACAPTWHPRLLPLLTGVRLTLAVGQYAHACILGVPRGAHVTQTVGDWRSYLDSKVLPLPHPSPRNRPWLMRHPWFEDDLLPTLRDRVRAALQAGD